MRDGIFVKMLHDARHKTETYRSMDGMGSRFPKPEHITYMITGFQNPFSQIQSMRTSEEGDWHIIGKPKISNKLYATDQPRPPIQKRSQLMASQSNSNYPLNIDVTFTIQHEKDERTQEISLKNLKWVKSPLFPKEDNEMTEEEKKKGPDAYFSLAEGHRKVKLTEKAPGRVFVFLDRKALFRPSS